MNLNNQDLVFFMTMMAILGILVLIMLVIELKDWPED